MKYLIAASLLILAGCKSELKTDAVAICPGVLPSEVKYISADPAGFYLVEAVGDNDRVMEIRLPVAQCRILKRKDGGSLSEQGPEENPSGVLPE